MMEMINELKEQMIQQMKNMIDDVKRSIVFMSDKFDNMIFSHHLPYFSFVVSFVLMIMSDKFDNMMEELTIVKKTKN